MILNTPKKKITILHPHFLKHGGASKVVLELSSRLINQGMSIEIITTRTNPDVIKNYPNLNFICLSNLTTGNLFFWILFPLFYLRLSKTLKKNDAKIIFNHSLAIYWGAAYKIFHKETIIVNYFHDLGMPYFDDKEELEGLLRFSKLILRIVSPIFKILNKLVIKQSDFIISNSNFTASEIQKKYGKKTDIIIYPAVNYDTFKPTKEKVECIYTLGRLEKIKKIDLIIKSFATYTQKYDDENLKLLIIGAGIEESKLKSLCESLHVKKRVAFHKDCSPAEVAEIAGKSRLGLFFRKNEPFGIAAVESMACGTPILGINSGGIAETVVNGETGVLIAADKDMIADKIHFLLQNKKILTEYSQNAVKHVKNSFDWNIEARKLSIFLKNL